MRMRSTRLLGVLAILSLTALTAGCNATVGVGVSVYHPGPWHGPWGGGVYVGGPVYR